MAKFLTNYGIEGKTFNYINGDKKSIEWTDEAAKMQSENPDKWQKDYRVAVSSFNLVMIDLRHTTSLKC